MDPTAHSPREEQPPSMDDQQLHQHQHHAAAMAGYDENGAHLMPTPGQAPHPYGATGEEADPNTMGPIKLFVGQVPRTMEEDELRPVLEAFGPLEDLVIIRDKLTGAHRGCAFASFFSREDAERAVAELHNKVVLPQSINPLQVRPAEGQAGASQEHKLFIGMIPKTADEKAIRNLFEPYGTIEEVYILRHPATGQSKGCAFLKFKERNSALSAIEEMNGIVTMDRGTSPLVVKFADSRRQRLQRARNLAAAAANAYWQLPPGAAAAAASGLSFPQLQQIQQQYLQQMQAFGAQASGINAAAAQRAAAAAAAATSQAGVPGSPTSSFMYYNPYAFGAAGSYGFNNSAAGAANSGVPGAAPVPGFDPVTNASVLGGLDVMAAAKAARTTTQLEGPAGANLFIYHLPHDLTDADLATAFAPFGSVISAKVYMDKMTGESKGFGFVSYDSAAAADAAIASMNGFQIGSKRLKVQHKRIHQRSDFGGETELSDPSGMALYGEEDSAAMMAFQAAAEEQEALQQQQQQQEYGGSGSGGAEESGSGAGPSTSDASESLESAVRQLRIDV